MKAALNGRYQVLSTREVLNGENSHAAFVFLETARECTKVLSLDGEPRTIVRVLGLGHGLGEIIVEYCNGTVAA